MKELLYKFWYWIGTRTGWLVRYAKERDKSLKNARRALEEAFTPEVEALLEKSKNDK
jgi:hypothetical protein